MSRKNRILMGAAYSVIEPLGLLHLAGLARDEGWERRIHLVREHNFDEFFRLVRDFKPNIIGFNVYTGNHLQLFSALEQLKKDHPNIVRVLGGPHATYFPMDCAEYADHVVMSEGFHALRRILQGTANKGIMPLEKIEPFPRPDRATFYSDYPRHANSPIKSIISMTGCPYSCTYCYNSTAPEDIAEFVSPDVLQKLIATHSGMGHRLFPHNTRSVSDIIAEGKEISQHWPTKLLYFQDDVFGFDAKHWMIEFAKRWPKDVGLPYHAQMRWDMTKNKQRLSLLRKSGCFGLTFAIEAAVAVIRKEILHRSMSDDVIFAGMKSVVDMGFKIRTEQITALPYGATPSRTSMNLDADLELVKFNVDLRERTGGPTMAWASTFVPYKGTKLGSYCEQYGYYIGNNNDVPDTFFERSILRFPREWVGPKLESLQEVSSIWLDPKELEVYRNRNAELRGLFNFFTLIPQGHVLARSYLELNEPFGYDRLGQQTLDHLTSMVGSNDQAALMLKDIQSMSTLGDRIGISPEEQLNLTKLAPYFGCLPKGNLAAERFIQYARARKSFSTVTLSNATRHHLYDEVLYSLE